MSDFPLLDERRVTAVVHTRSSVELVRTVVRTARAGSWIVRPQPNTPPGRNLVEIQRNEGSQALCAADVAAGLRALLAASEHGQLKGLRIIQGYDLLRTGLPSIEPHVPVSTPPVGYMGSLSEHLTAVAFRIQQAADRRPVFAWVDDEGSVFVAEPGQEPKVATSSIVGTFFKGVDLDDVENDLRAVLRERAGGGITDGRAHRAKVAP